MLLQKLFESIYIALLIICKKYFLLRYFIDDNNETKKDIYTTEIHLFAKMLQVS